MSHPATDSITGTAEDLLATFDDVLAQHVRAEFAGPRLDQLRAQFQAEHVAPLRGFCPPSLLRPLQEEACRLIDEHGVARNFDLAITDNTPRHMTTVGQPVIRDNGPFVHALYFAPSLQVFLSQLVDEELTTCPYAGEHYVISRLGKSGDTHGWHWDDYSYGFVIILEAPPYQEGGFVQAVPHTSWDKQNPDVYGALLKSEVRSYALEPGDAYMVKTNTTMHRVHPIRGESRRTIVNMTWACPSDLTRPMTHETNDVLFGGTGPDPAAHR